MKIENLRLFKKNNDASLAELRGDGSSINPKVTRAQEAETQARIIRENNDFHKPVFISINNK